MSKAHDDAEGRPEFAVRINIVPSGSEPFLYLVAANLHRVLHLTPDQNLSIWNHVQELYARAHKAVPELLRELDRGEFVEELTENEIFWGMVGTQVNRAVYSHAVDFLPAVFATAALLAARQDELPLSAEELSLLADPSQPEQGNGAPAETSCEDKLHATPSGPPAPRTPTDGH